MARWCGSYAFFLFFPGGCSLATEEVGASAMELELIEQGTGEAVVASDGCNIMEAGHYTRCILPHLVTIQPLAE